MTRTGEYPFTNFELCKKWLAYYYPDSYKDPVYLAKVEEILEKNKTLVLMKAKEYVPMIDDPFPNRSSDEKL